MGLVLLSSVLGGSVNVFTYGVVGKMSPVTFQVQSVSESSLKLVDYCGSLDRWER